MASASMFRSAITRWSRSPGNCCSTSIRQSSSAWCRFPDRKKTEESRGRRESAEKWFQRGLECEQTGAIPEAIKAYESAVALDPTSAGAWLNLGTIFFNARQFSKAEGHYRKALEADPKYALAHFNIANLYDERGDYERALRHYQEAVRLHPSYADAHYNLALLFQGSGQVMDAVRHWKTYLKLDPTSSWAAIARRELDKLRRYTVVAGKRAAGFDRQCSNSLIVGPRWFAEQAAIDPHRLARDEFSGIARQKRDHSSDIPRRPTRPSGVSFDHVPA